MHLPNFVDSLHAHAVKSAERAADHAGRGEPLRYRLRLRLAFAYERAAAEIAPTNEPMRAVLFASAASMASELRLYAEAVVMLELALKVPLPPDHERELRGLYVMAKRAWATAVCS